MKKVILMALMLSACASIPKLKDFNKVNMGMTKKQLIKQLGEPKSVRNVDGRELLEYEAEDSGESKPRLVVLQDNEVVFSGRPSEYNQASRQVGAQGPAINVTNAPIININTSGHGGGEKSEHGDDPPKQASADEDTRSNCVNSPVYTVNGTFLKFVKNCFGGQ